SHSQLDVCGQAGYNTRIVGGQSAAPGSWPWQIGVFKNGFLLCGGSLITSEWFVTAAQCFPSNDTSNLLVFLGSQTLLSLSPYRVFRTVTQIISHPDFNPATLDNDIALVRLSSPVNFTTHVLPVCLAASGSTFYNGTDAWVTGWGNTCVSSVPPPVPYNLREVDVPVVGNRQCNCDYGVGTITDNMMCAGSPAGGKGTCQGDGGGPLVSKQGGRWIQGGIVSFGIACVVPHLPGVYTRVSQYQSWISSQVASEQPGFVNFTSTGTDGDLTVTCLSSLPPVTILSPSTINSNSITPTILTPTSVAPPTFAPSTVTSTTFAPTTISSSSINPTTVAPPTFAPTCIAPPTLTPTTTATRECMSRVCDSLHRF
uniref:Peptidase S1 domain-containing protein n=1 Tax=Monopterus albus TaxID=43700 RepID=A0A3Q3QBE8_MONAL